MADLDTNVNGTQADQEAATQTETTPADDAAKTPTAEDMAAELKKLKADMAKQKSALDNATKEAANYKRQLRDSQSEEQRKAEEAREANEAMMQELETLRKERAVAGATQKVFTFIQDEATAKTVAEYLYGAEDIDGAISAIQKAWTAREKALKLEYSKIPAPAAGGSNGPTVTKEQLDAMKYTERVKFANEHPDEYNKLMGR